MFIDTETRNIGDSDDVQKHAFWLGCATYIRIVTKDGKRHIYRDRLDFTSIATFWIWLQNRTKQKTRIYIFAHNWSFDGAIIQLDVYPQILGYKCIKYVHGAPPVMITFKSDKASWQLLDTLNYYRMPLDKLGEELGVPKLPMPSYDAPIEEWFTYCRRDVDVIERAMLTFFDTIREYDLGNFSPTLASQSLSAYRHKYMPSKILLHREDVVNAMERRAYHGGRTEAFYIGQVPEKVYSLDVNSLYPYVMSKYPMPAIYKGMARDNSIENVTKWLSRGCIIADCLIKTDLPIYSYVHDARLIFPIGTFRATLTSGELSTAIQKQHLMAVYQWTYYESALLFKEFVDTLYALRLSLSEQGKDMQAYNIKILLNSLYGKFGQRSFEWLPRDIESPENLVDWIDYDPVTKTSKRYRKRLGVTQEQVKRKEAYYSNPAIAAHITAYARMELWDLITSAGLQNVYYCDTDSIMVNGTGRSRLHLLQDTKELGGLKTEWSSADVGIFGPKDYIHDGIRKIKGVRKKAEQIGPNKFRDVRFSSMDSEWRRGRTGIVTIEEYEKTLTREYKKGVVTNDGRVEPIRIFEE